MYRILRKKILAPAIKLLEVEAPLIAQSARPGQFIMLRIDDYGERIPLTIADFNQEKGTITIIFQEVGKSTLLLGQLQAGECIRDVAGPLGRPSRIEKIGRVAAVGGGVGVAPLYPIARALHAAGNEVIAILGARNSDLLILEEEMKQVSSRLLIATEDGSRGQQGLVTHLLKELMEKENHLDHVIAIGPVPMMEAVCQLTKEKNIPTTVSMNPIMVDGTGMCGACRVQVGGKTRFACVDGPEFDGHLVDWSLARQRLRMFAQEEKRALSEHTPENAEGGRTACPCHQ